MPARSPLNPRRHTRTHANVLGGRRFACPTPCPGDPARYRWVAASRARGYPVRAHWQRIPTLIKRLPTRVRELAQAWGAPIR